MRSAPRRVLRTPRRGSRREARSGRSGRAERFLGRRVDDHFGDLPVAKAHDLAVWAGRPALPVARDVALQHKEDAPIGQLARLHHVDVDPARDALAHPAQRLPAVLAAVLVAGSAPVDVLVQQRGDRIDISPGGGLKPATDDFGVALGHAPNLTSADNDYDLTYPTVCDLYTGWAS